MDFRGSLHLKCSIFAGRNEQYGYKTDTDKRL